MRSWQVSVIQHHARKIFSWHLLLASNLASKNLVESSAKILSHKLTCWPILFFRRHRLARGLECRPVRYSFSLFRDRYQYSGFLSFKFDININILVVSVSNSISISIFWRPLFRNDIDTISIFWPFSRYQYQYPLRFEKYRTGLLECTKY